MSKQHILYRRDYCGFCARVETVIQKLGVDIERRDIWEDVASYNEMKASTGRGAVPVLRIIDEVGESKWMSESIDIANYLIGEFGDS